MTNEFKRLDSLLGGAREAVNPETISSPLGSDTPPTKFRGIPKLRVQENTFVNWKPLLNPAMKPALERCLKVGRGEEWCALLIGPPGTGKTHLAIAAMHEFGIYRSYFWKVPEFLDWVRVTAYGEEMGVFRTLKSYTEGDFLLVLDDLGVEKDTDWVGETLYRVLDSRTDNQLPTIITSNQLPERIDPRLLSRFAEGLVVCEGKDIRRSGIKHGEQA